MEESALSNLSEEEQEALVKLIIIYMLFGEEIAPIIDKIGKKYNSHI